MSDLEGFDPNDIAELKATAERVVKDATTYYEIGIYVPHKGATEFLDMYNKANNGNVLALIDMMMFLHVIAESLREAVERENGNP